MSLHVVPCLAQVAIGIGDLGLAYQAFKIAISVDSNHAESYANLGVLELRKGNIDAARSNFRTVQVVTLPLRYRYNTVTLPLRYHYITVTSRSNFRTVQNIAPHMFEPFFNGALLAYKLGDFQEAYDLASKVT